MKNTCLSLPRFVNLCQKEMVECWKLYALRFALIYGVMAIAFILYGLSAYSGGSATWYRNQGLTTDPAWDFVFRVFIIGLFIFGCISASMMMERMKRKTSRMSVLLTPVTPFEYFFTRWLICTVGFVAFYVVAFMLADWTRVLFFMLKAPEGIPVQVASLNHLLSSSPFGIMQDPEDTGLMIGTLLYLSLQSFFALGSSIWPKNSFLKTFTAGILLMILYAMVVKACLDIRSGGFSGNVYAGEHFMCTLMAVFTVANWVLAYYRFKESEIINRF